MDIDGFPTGISDGKDFLVVWQADEVYAARVTDDGTVLDPVPMTLSKICGKRTLGEWPFVSYDGSHYVVIWEEFDEKDRTVLIARVDSQDGTLDQSGKLLMGPEEAYTSFIDDFICGPSGCVLFSESDHPDPMTQFRRGHFIDANTATATGPIDLGVSTVGGTTVWEPVAGAQSFAVLRGNWSNSSVYGNSLYTTVFTSEAVDSPPQEYLLGEAMDIQDFPLIAATPSGFIVVWIELGSNMIVEPSSLMGVRVGPGGEPLDTPPVLLATFDDDTPVLNDIQVRDGLIVVLGAYYTSVWDVEIRPIAVVDEELVPSSNPVDSIMRACSQPMFAAGWCSESHCLGMSFDGKASFYSKDDCEHHDSEVTVINGARWKNQPAAANGSSQHLIAWREYSRSDELSSIWARRIAHNGAPIDDTPILVSDPTIRSEMPAIAFDGEVGLIAWTSGCEVLGRRISSDGEVIDPAPISMGTNCLNAPPVLAPRKTGFVVSQWSFDEWLEFVEVPQIGPPADPKIVTVPGLEPDSLKFLVLAALAQGNEGYLAVLVWSRETTPNQQGLSALCLSDDLQPVGVAVELDRGYAPFEDAEVVFDGESYTIAWLGPSNMNDTAPSVLQAAKLSSACALLSPQPTNIGMVDECAAGLSLSASNSTSLVAVTNCQQSEETSLELGLWLLDAEGFASGSWQHAELAIAQERRDAAAISVAPNGSALLLYNDGLRRKSLSGRVVNLKK